MYLQGKDLLLLPLLVDGLAFPVESGTVQDLFQSRPGSSHCSSPCLQERPSGILSADRQPSRRRRAR